MATGARDNHYTYAQLMQLWVSAGGSKLNAAMAAAIAMAESGGNPTATNRNGNGSIDRGLWQINSIHGSLSTMDPTANARAAIQLSKNGTTWRPWCTAYSDGLCGSKGGTYMGAGAPFMKYLNGSTGSAVKTGTNTTPNSGTTQLTAFPTTQDASWWDWIIPFGNGTLQGMGLGGLSGGGGGDIFGMPLGGVANTLEGGIAGGIMDVLKPVGRLLLHTLFVVGGVVMMGFGASLMFKDSDMGLTKHSETEDEVGEQIQDVDTNGPHPDQPQYGKRSNRGRQHQGIRQDARKREMQESAKGKHRRPGRAEKAASRTAKAAEVGEAAI